MPGAGLTNAFKGDRIDRIIPAGIESLCSQYGLENEAEFREMVRTRIEQRVHVRQHVAMRQQVARHLVESAKIDLPERMTTTQAARIFERRRMDLMYRGIDQAQIEQHIAELRAASSQDAANELKLFFILNKAADEMDVKVQEAEVNGRIAEMAMEQGVRPEKLRQDLIQSNRIGSIAQQIREHKALDAVVDKASVIDVSPEEFSAKLQSMWGDEEGELEGASLASGKSASKPAAKKTTAKKDDK